MSALAASLTSSEKGAISYTCKKYLLNDPKLSRKFLSLNEADRDWILSYLSSGKGIIPYKLKTDFDSVSISPDKDFFEVHHFYSDMKDSVLST